MRRSRRSCAANGGDEMSQAEGAGTTIIRRDGYVLFWSGWPSNWHPSTFVVDGILFNCGEQWMMWSKAKFFDDVEMMRAILAEPSPREQKALGRQVKNYDDARWKVAARDIVCCGLLEKFRQNP